LGSWQGARLEASVHFLTPAGNTWVNSNTGANTWTGFNAGPTVPFNVNTTSGQFVATGPTGDFEANVAMTVFYDDAIAVIDTDWVIDLNSALIGTTTATNDSQRVTLEQTVTNIFLENMALVQKFRVGAGETLDIIARNLTDATNIGFFACTIMVTAI
jgi:hypothetical protein